MQAETSAPAGVSQICRFLRPAAKALCRRPSPLSSTGTPGSARRSATPGHAPGAVPEGGPGLEAGHRLGRLREAPLRRARGHRAHPPVNVNLLSTNWGWYRKSVPNDDVWEGRMHTLEQRERAVGLYVGYGGKAAATTRELGRPKGTGQAHNPAHRPLHRHQAPARGGRRHRGQEARGARAAPQPGRGHAGRGAPRCPRSPRCSATPARRRRRPTLASTPPPSPGAPCPRQRSRAPTTAGAPCEPSGLRVGLRRRARRLHRHEGRVRLQGEELRRGPREVRQVLRREGHRRRRVHQGRRRRVGAQAPRRGDDDVLRPRQQVQGVPGPPRRQGRPRRAPREGRPVQADRVQTPHLHRRGGRVLLPRGGRVVDAPQLARRGAVPRPLPHALLLRKLSS